jgi:hypothetical protein
LGVGSLHRGVKQHDRDRLLERIDRDGATVGASIPETISVGEADVALRSFVHAARAGDRSPEAVRSMIENLRAERQRRRAKIEAGDLDLERAEALADSIIGIDRALTVLESDGETDLEAETRRRRQADQERWRNFVRQVTGDRMEGRR